jgi:hypothetical protein
VLLHSLAEKKAMAGAPKLLIAGAFWFVGEYFSSPGIKKLPLAHLVYASGITFYPWRTSNRCAGIQILKIPKIPKYFKIVKT